MKLSMHTHSCCGQSWQKRKQYFVAVLKLKLAVQKDFVNIQELYIMCKDHKVQSAKNKNKNCETLERKELSPLIPSLIE